MASTNRRQFLRTAAAVTPLALAAGKDTRAAQDNPPAVIDIGSRRELFVDRALVDRLVGRADLRLHHPTPRDIALVHDAPWEGSGSGYHSVFQDGTKYRMYYKAWHLEPRKGKLNTAAHPLFTCYAESDDGVAWRKPKLGLHEFRGSKDNNIAIASGKLGEVNADAGHPAVFRDENPDAPADARYKALVRSSGPHGLLALKSADGLRWEPMADEPVITAGAFDSQNLAFWDPPGRQAVPGVLAHLHGRHDRREGVEAGRGAGRPHRDLEGLPDLGGPGRPDLPRLARRAPLHQPGEAVPPRPARPRRLPDPVRRAGLVGVDAGAAGSGAPRAPGQLGPAVRDRPHRGPAHGEPRRRAVERWNDAFLPPGPEREGTWNYGHQYIAWHLVETKSSLPGAANELSLYAGESYWTGDSSELRRHTLRLDGFVSAHAPMAGGELVTKPLTFAGKLLALNFATSAAGAVRVELQDAAGKPRTGFALEDCPPIFGDAVDRAVGWKGQPDLAKVAGRAVRVRFVLNDAHVYAFQFRT